MSKIICKCGQILSDSTDQLRYKGYIISDKEYFNMFDFADQLIESDCPQKDNLAMTFRHNISVGNSYIRLKEIFQCPLCGRIMIETMPGCFCFFTPEDDNKKNLLDYGVETEIEYIKKQ